MLQACGLPHQVQELGSVIGDVGVKGGEFGNAALYFQIIRSARALSCHCACMAECRDGSTRRRRWRGFDLRSLPFGAARIIWIGVESTMGARRADYPEFRPVNNQLGAAGTSLEAGHSARQQVFVRGALAEAFVP